MRIAAPLFLGPPIGPYLFDDGEADSQPPASGVDAKFGERENWEDRDDELDLGDDELDESADELDI